MGCASSVTAKRHSDGTPVPESNTVAVSPPSVAPPPIPVAIGSSPRLQLSPTARATTVTSNRPPPPPMHIVPDSPTTAPPFRFPQGTSGSLPTAAATSERPPHPRDPRQSPPAARPHKIEVSTLDILTVTASPKSVSQHPSLSAALAQESLSTSLSAASLVSSIDTDLNRELKEARAVNRNPLSPMGSNSGNNRNGRLSISSSLTAASQCASDVTRCHVSPGYAAVEPEPWWWESFVPPEAPPASSEEDNALAPPGGLQWEELENYRMELSASFQTADTSAGSGSAQQTSS